MFYYKSVPIRTATRKGQNDMYKLNFSFGDVEKILIEGHDCPHVKRKPNIEERCIRKDKKLIKVVVEKIISTSGFPYWRIRHVGETTYRKVR